MQRVTADDIIKRFNDLPMKLWPENAHQVIMNGDDWTGHMVVKASDIVHLVAWLVSYVEHRN